MTMAINRKRRLLIAGASAAGLGLMAALTSAQSNERVIKIVAKKFDYTPANIDLVKGEPVTLELTSLDVTMGFNLPDFHLRTDIIPGKVSTLRFTPDKVGKFDFYCDVFCGDGHEDMDGVITVT